MEFKSILEYYRERNSSSTYSLKLVKVVDSIIDLLQQNNDLGRVTDDGIVRVIPFDSYLIFYELNKEELLVLSVWDNRQDPNKRIDA